LRCGAADAAHSAVLAPTRRPRTPGHLGRPTSAGRRLGAG